TAEEEEDFGE
nr:Chain C, peptide from Tubulin beta chain [synthetic construct]